MRAGINEEDAATRRDGDAERQMANESCAMRNAK
jgi:hypothetical protein